MFRTFLIKLFLLLSRLGFRERIIRIFAYFPPPLPSYTLRDHTGEEDEDEIISLVGDKNSLINT